MTKGEKQDKCCFCNGCDEKIYKIDLIVELKWFSIESIIELPLFAQFSQYCENGAIICMLCELNQYLVVFIL